MKTLALLAAGISLNFAALAAPETFDFKDPKGVNNIIFKTDAPLESINGTATGVSGSVDFDPANPGALKGQIVVEGTRSSIASSGFSPTVCIVSKAR